MLPVAGHVRRDDEGLTAQFSLEIEDGVIRAVSFNISFCVSLIGYCELLAEWATGATLHSAVRLHPAQLVAALPEVPAYKRALALLATAAFLSALGQAVEDKPP